ncbi:MAG TPA: hypothetical protein VNT27_10860, partial [Propionibacteriaceae bacterium]|nr:hypothetical protein [Propionibacteriaceae bacterium]
MATVLAVAMVPIPAHAQITPSQLGVGTSTQVLIVSSSSWGTSYATLQTWQKTSAGWAKPYGAMRARIGRNGFVKHAERLQNSGTTPAGNYRITKTFGQSTNPGTKMPYRDVDSTDYWV